MMGLEEEEVDTSATVPDCEFLRLRNGACSIPGGNFQEVGGGLVPP